MPDALRDTLYVFSFILIVSRFLGGLDFGIVKIPDFPKPRSNRVMWIGIAMITSLLVYDNRDDIFGVSATSSSPLTIGTLRFKPEKKTTISLPESEVLEAHLEPKIYTQHHYVYLRFDAQTRLQLYMLQAKQIGSKNQGCTIELVAYSEVPPTADVEIACP